MGGNINSSIKDDFDFYLKVCSESKSFEINPIELSEIKSNHTKTRMKCVDVKHSTISHKMLFCVESDITNARNFKLKLWCNEKFECPLFRFDSDGATHRNNDPNIPLDQQAITTPHFHKFNKDGIEYAYKTSELNDTEQKEKIVNDINLAAILFCREANLVTTTNPSIIQVPSSELPFTPTTSTDPTKNVTFV
jgi:hypothetical protein